MSELADLWLKPHEERRLRAGHLWVFGNEVDTRRSPLKAFQAGQSVVLREAGGKALGCAYVNPQSLIFARLVSRSAEQPLNRSLLVHRIKVALSLRERLYPRPFYRLIYGDSDGLSGLIIDRFDDVCVLQINTAGMEAVRNEIVEALEQTLAPRRILLRADNAIRELEGLEQYVQWAGDEGPSELAVEENGCRFLVPATGGPKTGWYYDHRANRARLAPYVRDRKVLDVFSYVGGWGIQALTMGAAEAMCIDNNEQALDFAQRNAELNGVAERFAALEGDAAQALRALKQDGHRFDTVILDPPAYIKRRKDYKVGLKAYSQLNQLAMQLLGKDGMLISASSSSHLTEEDFLQALLKPARHLDRQAQVVETGGQAADHPINPAIPETRYLKAAFSRVLLGGV
ncbi:class I SAM-dependent rRNA methyltransferase [Alkalilimnicola sp. S0819]|uniref:class I SAM-dependent rRNA methyltransferase n=1 Tax=Alkalilimnicola sp. S0819 TaxID=2613922 RepID=UPI0012629320|nr:class I SAM-dependent rRNA methyltransferase [Alkalilimnicola sp. S0819]KAB7623008.1 class I SAM-dependent rRNA methyltransferase [Alkalilimnicola sp. S0819]MPQ17120.1 methyltransferase [Alkalilimnicola sp. S0819]